MKKATALLTNWKRRDNLPKVLASLRAQSIPIEIFLWDNSGYGGFRDLVELEIVASSNLKCFPRWGMARFASSDFVFSLDDDLAIKDPLTIERCCQFVGQTDAALGKEGVTVIPGNGYRESIHIACNTHAISSVDILKGRFIFARKETIIQAMPQSQATLFDPRIEDDIAISAGITGQKILPDFLDGAFKELPQLGVGEYHSPEHMQSRESAFAYYFEP